MIRSDRSYEAKGLILLSCICLCLFADVSGAADGFALSTTGGEGGTVVTVTNAADVPTMVQAYAGAGTPYPPHWLSGPYGDFDKDGDVDTDDLEMFAGYWLDTNHIADADYDASGRVDMAELALFAYNWLLGL